MIRTSSSSTRVVISCISMLSVLYTFAYISFFFGVVLLYITKVAGIELIPGWGSLQDQLVYSSLLARSDMLPTPVTAKDEQNLENEKYRLGFSGMQGWRRRMEDAHLVLLNMSKTHPDHAFFGVFDGHSGPETSVWAATNLPTHIESTAHFDKEEYESALTAGFISVDRELKRQQIQGGSTGVTALITPQNQIYCANVGDSRCVVSKKGVAVDLSIDHKPTLPAEQKRIAKGNGYVQNGRVLGTLAMSRAFGDFMFKGNGDAPEDDIVTVVPEIISTKLTTDMDFMIIACDGIWDCMTSQQVVDYVSVRLSNDCCLSEICSSLFSNIMSPKPFGLGCDNMSMMIIQFKHPEPEETTETNETASDTHEDKSSEPSPKSAELD